MIIALSGFRRSGKDAAGVYLVERGFKRLAFADILKDMASELFSIKRESFDNPATKDSPLYHLPIAPADTFSLMINNDQIKEYRTRDGKVIDVKINSLEEAATNPYKLYQTPRSLLILLGSMMRSVRNDYWVQKALDSIDLTDNIVITDMRYPSEAEQIKAFAKEHNATLKIVRVNRFDTTDSVDPSERSMDNYVFDHVIENRSTLQDYYAKIDQVVLSSYKKP
jgi:hypothetical protein